MSLKVAAILNGFINVALLPLSRRQRLKTMARVATELQNKGVTEIPTPKGILKFHALRGAGAASAVATFQTDEPETLAWIDEYVKPGHTLWDVGASIGLFSLYAALTPDVKVLAFEPSALNFSLLAEHIALNDKGHNITPFCAALAQKTCIETLHMRYYDTGSAGNAIGIPEVHANAFTPLFSQTVPAFSGDDLCHTLRLSPPDHLKLDVDGIEGAILRGMPETLASISTVMVEVEGRNSTKASDIIDPPLLAAGFHEDETIRSKGSCRNRLFINKKLQG